MTLKNAKSIIFSKCHLCLSHTNTDVVCHSSKLRLSAAVSHLRLDYKHKLKQTTAVFILDLFMSKKLTRWSNTELLTDCSFPSLWSILT